jgi:AcrR family transcriptional regulator
MPGYGGASIREIARRADVSSALLYHFFSDKTDLFAKVLTRRADAQQVLTFPPWMMELPPEDALPLLARGFTGMMANPEQVGLMKLMLRATDRHPELMDVVRETIIHRALKPLQGYFAHQMALGRIRRLPLPYLTQAFLGLFMGLIMRRELLQEPESRAWPIAEYADTAIAIFLGGLALAPGEAPEIPPPSEPTPAPAPAAPRARRATRITLDTDES